MEDIKDRSSTTALPLEEVPPPDSPELSRMHSFHIEEEQGRLASDLPPVDGGRKAWSYLIAATVMETLVWGLATSYGVFLTRYEKTWPNATTLLPQIGTITTGIMYLFLPPLALYLAKYPRYRPLSMWIGLVLSTLGLVVAGFADEPWQLMLSQGVLFALGGLCLYCPATAYMFEWWQSRRGLASGIMYSGTGLGGLTIPFIASGLLDKYGRRTTLISLAIGYAIILSATIPFVKPRLPLSTRAVPREPPKIHWDFLGRWAFWALWLGVLLQGLGSFIPGTYLPSFANALRLNETAGTLTLAMTNFGRVPGQVLIGHVSDKVGPRRIILGMAIVSSVSVYLIWGFAASEPVLLVFSLVFGAFAGSYTALFPKFIHIVCDNDPTLPQIIYALFSVARGLGNILSGPVSTGLLSLPGLHHAKGAYGVGAYGLLILWTGAMLLGSGVGAGYKGLKRD